MSAENLTVASSAFFGGVTSFGYSDGAASGAGFTIDAFSGISTVQHEEVIPAHTVSVTTWEDVWGMVPGASETVWVEDYGPTTDQVWVDDYGETTETIWVDDYGQVPTTTWIPDQYDADNNLITAGYYETTWSEGIVGGHYEYVWGVVGGHYEDVPGWGVVGGHNETISGEDVPGVVDTIQQVTETWVPEQSNSYTETVTGLPIIRQIGKTANSVWKWKNLDRELMELSPAGLSIPSEGDTNGSNRALLTSTMLEQSYTTSPGAATYFSYGVKMQKDGVEAWRDTGANDVVQVSETLKLKPSEIVLKEETPIGGTNSVETRTTRVGVNSSRFGGLVEVAGDMKVQGVLRVRPGGDLVMGDFTNGPQP
ncbi:MAG: hypothetical protein U0984_05770 [Prosthecobacter sp.]|nr:hypothetical protein [Prosthecobacter sp.]